MRYFLGNPSGLDYVDYISSTYRDVDTGAVEGEREDRLYYIKKLKDCKHTSFGTVFTKKLTYCPRKSFKAKVIMMFGREIKLMEL